MAVFHHVVSARPGATFAIFRDNQEAAVAVAQAMRAAGVEVVAHRALDGKFAADQQTEIFQPLIIAAVAAVCLDVETMETRNSDRLDFKEVHVSNLARVMQAMLQIGAASQVRGK